MSYSSDYRFSDQAPTLVLPEDGETVIAIGKPRPLGYVHIGGFYNNWKGIHLVGDGAKRFWKITCPCGVEVEYPLNGLPEVTTKHPCEHPEHFTVSYDD